MGGHAVRAGDPVDGDGTYVVECRCDCGWIDLVESEHDEHARLIADARSAAHVRKLSFAEPEPWWRRLRHA